MIPLSSPLPKMSNSGVMEGRNTIRAREMKKTRIMRRRWRRKRRRIRRRRGRERKRRSLPNSNNNWTINCGMRD